MITEQDIIVGFVAELFPSWTITEEPNKSGLIMDHYEIVVRCENLNGDGLFECVGLLGSGALMYRTNEDRKNASRLSAYKQLLILAIELHVRWTNEGKK